MAILLIRNCSDLMKPKQNKQNNYKKSHLKKNKLLLTLIWVGRDKFTPPPPSLVGFSLINSEVIKAVTLAFCSIQ